MATAPLTSGNGLVIGETVTARIERAESRKNIFLLWLEGSTAPVIVSKAIVAEDFYVHKSQFIGITATVTPTQASNGQLPGFLANVDLPVAAANNNQLVMYKQQRAANYQSAALYAVNVAEEV